MSNDIKLPYKYGATLDILFDNGENIHSINNTHISYIFNDFEYDKYNMPITMVKVTLDKRIIDKLVEESNTTLINFTIYNYVDNGNSNIPINYIKDQFTYFINKDYNINDDIDYVNSTEEVLDLIEIGLLKLDLVNKNNNSVNGVISNTTIQSAVAYCLKDLPILIEPFNHNINIEQLILPPMNSLAKILTYLNTSFHTFYNTPYRFFMDFNNSYLLSSSGLVIPKTGDTINNIIITIYSISEFTKMNDGMIIDNDNKLYKLTVGEESVKFYNDTNSQKSLNTINVVSDGSVTTTKLNVGGANYINTKENTIRVPNNNTGLLDNIQYHLESSIGLMELSVSHVDTSILTINREYNIVANSVYPDRDGKYLLVRKKEVYIRDGDNFVLNILMTFRKLKT